MRFWKGALLALLVVAAGFSIPASASAMQPVFYYGIHLQQNGPFGERLMADLPGGFYAVMDSALIYYTYWIIMAYLDIDPGTMINTNWTGAQERDLFNIRIGPSFEMGAFDLLVGVNLEGMMMVLPKSDPAITNTGNEPVLGLPIGLEAGLSTVIGPLHIMALGTAQILPGIQSHRSDLEGVSKSGSRIGIDIYFAWFLDEAFALYGSLGWGFVKLPEGYYATNSPAYEYGAPMITFGAAF